MPRFVRWPGLVLALSLVVGPATAGDPDPIETASRLYQAGSPQEAERILRLHMEISPSAEAADTLGSILALSGRVDEAVVWFRRAVESDPGHAAFRKNLANGLFALGDVDGSEEQLFRAVRLEGATQLVANGRRLLDRAGRHSRALALVDSAIAAHGPSPSLQEHRAAALLRLGRLEQAAHEIELALPGVEPERARALRRFLALERLGHVDRQESESRRRLRPPLDLILVTLDTTRADAVGTDGRSRTPVLDRLALQGTRFLEARSTAPVTLPAHASLFTGRYPPGHGARNNGTTVLAADVPTLASLLQSEGYRTGAFVSSYVLDRRYGLDRGFDTYGDRFRRPHQAGPRFPVDRDGAETVSDAVSWLRQQPDADPVFLWLHLYDPHSDYSPPPPYDLAWQDDPYAGEIAFADLCIGRLLADLDRLGRRSNSLIVVTGDHGEALGEHGEPTHGLFLYDSTLHVPLMIVPPGGGAGSSVEDPVSHVDVLPTILELLEISAPAGLAGASLAPAVRGQPLRLPHRPLYSETLIPGDFDWSPLAAAVTGPLKFILAPRPELYDLAVDPGEKNNLLGGEAADHRLRKAARSRSWIEERLAEKPRTSSRPHLDDEAIAKLLSLGYFHGGGEPVELRSGPDSALPDPKERVSSFRTYLRASSLADDGRWAEAERAADELIETDPSSPRFRSLRAEFRDRQDDLVGTEQDLAAALAVAPGDPRYAFSLAMVRHRRGRLEQAEAGYRQALRLDPAHLLAHYNLGRLLIERGDFEQGERETRAALAIDPRHAQALNNLGFVLIVRDRDFETGLGLLRQAVEQAPGDPILSDSLAWALHNAGHEAEARREMARALELASRRPPDAAYVDLLNEHARVIGLAPAPDHPLKP